MLSKLNAKNRFKFDAAVILLFSLLVTVPILLNGMPGGNDMPQHFQFAQTFYNSMLNGEIYPSWAGNPNYGFGDVSVRFYPPLTYFLLAFFRFVAGNWFDAAYLNFTFLFFAGGIGAYKLAREFFSENAALCGALVYIFVPYHLNQLYGAALFAEFTAAAFIPFCFLFAARICRQGRLFDVGGLALAFGLLVLSHLPSIIIVSICLLIFSLLSLKKDNFFKAVFKLAAAVLLGLLASCFYWARMVAELDFVKHNSEAFATDFYSYKSYFAFASLFEFTGVNTAQTSTFLDLMFLVMLGILIPNAFIYFTNVERKSDSRIRNLAVITVFSMLMATPLSLKIWEFLPFLQKIQFPWRWLMIASVGGAFFAAAGFDFAVKLFKTSKRHLAILAFGLILVCIPFNFLRIMNPLFSYPKDYFNTVVENFKSSAGCECWWSVWAEKDALLDRTKISVNNRQSEITNWLSTDRNFTIEAGEAGKVRLATFYYLRWQATVNGAKTEVTPDENGAITFEIPAEKSDVRLFFVEPPFVRNTFYISILTWFAVFGLLILGLWKQSSKSKI